MLTAPLVQAQTELDDRNIFDLSLEELKTIKISSTTKTEVKLQQAPAIVSVITRSDLDRYQWRSVADSLRTQAGVDVLFDLTLYNVGMRGLAGGYAAQGQSIKAMIDGQDMAFKPTATNFLGSEFMPDIAIDHIEVIRGPLSTLYGADAFSGVINVVPKTARKMAGNGRQFELQQQFVERDGELGYQTQMASWHRGDTLDWFAAISLEHNDRAGLALPESSPRYAAFALRGLTVSDSEQERTRSVYLSSVSTGDWGQWLLDYNYQYLRRGANFYPESEPLSNALVSFSNQMARLRWRGEWTDSLTAKATFALNSGEPGDDTRLYDPFRFTADYLYRDYWFRQYTSALELDYELKRWSLVGGADYTFDTEALPTLVIVDKDGSRSERNGGRQIDVANIGAYLQLQAQLWPELQLTAGYRVDEHSLYARQTSARAGLVYSHSERTTFKLLAGSAFKAPALMLMFGGEHPRLLGPAPNRALQPQKTNTLEANASTQFSSALQAGLTVYRSSISDYAEYDTIAANPQAHNRGQIDAKGAELELRYQSIQPAIDAFFNLSWVDTALSTDVPVGIEVSEQSRLYPARSLGLGISHAPQAIALRWSLSVLAVGPRYADKSNLPFLPLDAQQEYALPGYALVDLGLVAEQWPLFAGKRTQWSLSVKNAADRHYVEPGFSGIDVPGIGRRWLFTVKQSF